MRQSFQFTPGILLLAENDPLVHKFLRKVLDKAGFTVLSAATSEEALRIEAAFPEKIDLLLTAFTMPGLSGSDLAEAVARRRPELTVILMSSYPEVEKIASGHGWYYLMKPFVAAALFDLLRDMLGIKVEMLIARV